MSETEFKVGEFYRIIDVGDNDVHFDDKKLFVGKTIKLTSFDGKLENDFVACSGEFQEITDKRTEKRGSSSKGRWIFFLEIKLEKI